MTALPPADTAGPASHPAVDHRTLLRTYEPVLWFTEGELFLPTSVAHYVAQCSLRTGGPDRSTAPVVPAGGLTLEGLGALGEQFRDRPLYLRYVQQPLQRAEVRAWRRRTRPRLRGAGRLAAVGVLARLVDVVLRLSLLVRGRVPGGLVAAAERLTSASAAPDSCPYYGRVVNDGGYTICQYWFFYAFNDWRSTFHGVNDHEADWEMVAVYLAGSGGQVSPAWVAASSHDHHGAVLRRRWDDPGLRREGQHPVVFPGAGSHSGAFLPGDYVIAVEIPTLRRVRDAARRWLRRGPSTSRGVALPFIDYARGDGIAVGPGHTRTWWPELIDDDTPWVTGFRGLWGLDTRDAFGGERAPAGPRYERSGELRRAWADPLGWAGLTTVAPTAAEEHAALRARLEEVAGRLAVLDEAIAAERSALRGLRAQARSLGTSADTRRLQQDRVAELGTREAGLTAMTAERTRLLEERAVHASFLARPLDPGPPDAHLRAVSLPGTVRQHNAFLRLWAALSTPVIILGIGVLLTRPNLATLSAFATFLAVVIVVEAAARGRIRLFLLVLAALAAGVGAVTGAVLALLSNWQAALAVLLAVTGLVLLAANLHELVGTTGRRKPTTPAGPDRS
ncbi:hypothetical protein [Geodermatophilus normandii]|uniref:Uncharacterized protein n=1 Tax=Geodermatophilus normandii TaxID=1137989 RepID=A0A6P0GHY2_9ACTN|nr:hypothetical protein [Geodermatophilus normandii]NEM06898.1 hypothetical protein [Geodermatophilus normandii]